MGSVYPNLHLLFENINLSGIELAVNDLELSQPTGPPLSQQREVRLNQGWQKILFGINVSVP